MLCHPCLLGGPQRQARGAKLDMVASPLPRREAQKRAEMLHHPCILRVPNAKRGEPNQKGLSHPCLLGGPKEGGNPLPPLRSRRSPTTSAGSKIRNGCLTPSLSGGPKEGGNATSPLHPRGSPTPSAGTKIRNGCLTPDFVAAQKRAELLRHPCILGGPQRQARAVKSEVAISPLPSRGGQKRAEMLCNPCFLGGPQCQAREANQKWLSHSLLLGSPKEGRNATSPLRPRGSPTPSAGGGIRSGYLTPAFSGGKKRAEMLCHPCLLGGPQRQARGANSEMVVSFLTSWQPERGRKCYISPPWSGVPNAKRGEQNQKWLSHHCLLGGQKEGGNALPPMHSRRSPTPSAGSKIRDGCLSPALSGGPKVGENATSPLHSRGSPAPSAGSKIRNGCVTPDFLAAQKRAEMPRHPCMLGGPQRQARGAKSEVAISPLPSRGAKRGLKSFATPACSGVPNAKRGE